MSKDTTNTDTQSAKKDEKKEKKEKRNKKEKIYKKDANEIIKKTEKINNYNVTTNIVALSKVKDLLSEMDIGNIPVFDFDKSDKEKEEIENLVVTFILQLSSKPKTFDNFFQTITQTNDDFSNFDAEICVGIAINFFEKLPSAFIRTIKTHFKELKKQKNMAMKKSEKMMEKAIKKEVTKMIKPMLKNSKDLETIIENG